jgi:hypothetical protein
VNGAPGASQDRRNMTEAELWKCIRWMDKRKERGGDHKTDEGKSNAQSCAIDRSSQQTAQTLGISARKVEQARTVMDHGDEATKQAIEEGEMSFEKHKHQRESRNHQVHGSVMADRSGLDQGARFSSGQDRWALGVRQRANHTMAQETDCKGPRILHQIAEKAPKIQAYLRAMRVPGGDVGHGSYQGQNTRSSAQF